MGKISGYIWFVGNLTNTQQKFFSGLCERSRKVLSRDVFWPGYGDLVRGRDLGLWRPVWCLGCVEVDDDGCAGSAGSESQGCAVCGVG